MASLLDLLPRERILDRLVDRIAYSSDAGFYYLLPFAVVKPVDESEIIDLLRFSRQQGIPIVFRAGGTSLSGQSVTDGILVDISQYWSRIRVEAAGNSVRVQPGITGAMVNLHLKKYGRKIGPDPSSISAAMMGGILSNNASGMCCGTKYNSYHTTRHIRFILPNGNGFSTENREDYVRFEYQEQALYEGIEAMRNEIKNDTGLAHKIRHKYRLKTTVGYSLNAFLDHDHPMDIFSHLLIGGEGTLGFIAEAVLQTIPDPPFTSTALLYFPTIQDACHAIEPLTHHGAAMVELMDRASLMAVENMEGSDVFIKSLPESASALLVEFQENSPGELDAKVNQFLRQCDLFNLLRFPSFTSNENERNHLWKIRKGLFPSVGAVRKKGTTVILEDIAFPVPQLGNAIHDLQLMFRKYHYDNAIIFGHAKDGNIHFVITQSFGGPEEVSRYDGFIREVVQMVVRKYDGTLKAEHGTGRNMAPFVETEWGPEAYGLMKRIKQLVDPEGLLNPGVIINEDANAHIAHLKAMPQVEEEVDKCIECGYCEPVCPSRNLTTSPRRRIVIRRALERFRAASLKRDYKKLLQQFRYEGIDTCAVDGLCAGSCPVNINTGDLIKRLRRESHSTTANALALFAAKHFGKLQAAVRISLQAGFFLNRVFGKKTMFRLTASIKKIYSRFPLWTDYIVSPPVYQGLIAYAEGTTNRPEAQVVYFPSCISRIMGSYEGRPQNIMECFLSICKKAKVNVLIPENISSQCCSQVFSSKGFADAYRYKANETVAELWKISQSGLLPIVTDVSSCAYTLKTIYPVLDKENRIRYAALKIWDAVEFIYNQVLPQCKVSEKKKEIVLHPVCALEKMNIVFMLQTIAGHFAEKVTLPMHAGCCGMAGDRGFLVPALTRSATEKEAEELNGIKADGFYSSTKTCEMALSEATGQDYVSILFLVEECMAG